MTLSPKHKGAALISVLFIAAIIVMIATAFALHIRHLIDTSLWGKESNQIDLALDGVKYWGISVLLNAKPVKGSVGVILPPRSNQMGPIQYYNVTVTGKIIDQSGLYNINLLANKTEFDGFVRLARALNLPYSKQQLYTFAETIQKAILQQGSANNPQFFDTSALLTVPNLPTKLYRELQPYITVLPATMQKASININHTSAPVLMASSQTLTFPEANAIIYCVKGAGPFENVQQFNNTCLTSMKISKLPNVTVSSQYYMIIGQGKLGPLEHTLRTFIQTTIDKNTLNAVVIWQAIT